MMNHTTLVMVIVSAVIILSVAPVLVPLVQSAFPLNVKQHALDAGGNGNGNGDVNGDVNGNGSGDGSCSCQGMGLNLDPKCGGTNGGPDGVYPVRL